MRRPATSVRSTRPRRGRLFAAVAGAALAAALGLTGALGLSSSAGPAAGHGHGVHTDVQSWS